ncbi:MAG: ATP-binding cassette domain-containing protein [Rouxiella badensis]|jgi:D-methionine transport system ATP-binding protein|uniref:methionine ABC transporter ATP-binding protein n=1 Tax=Rouxiella badensis TaxID=1646377 RepID=UPI0017882CB9|nr:ATP-binding cassette domain-containing protein [Rouxiella badensis]QOI54952.1 ATP-binding cassette domain-containing protein [Rouxiella badensis subsp. acadiensis]
MIELHDVDKVFQRKGITTRALNNINLRVERGDIFGIIGYSGAGKSTLVRLINALETPSAGEVVINGQAIGDFNSKQLREMKKDIGMIFQGFNLLESKTVWKNVAIPLILAGKSKAFIAERVKELLQLVGLGDRAGSYPGELSGGQKQRVGIARALATNPSILLCDEATSALDPQTTGQILMLLKRISHEFNVTLVLITHEMSVIQKICNKVAVMEQGRIVEQGNVIDVFGHPQHPTTLNFVRTLVRDSLPESIEPHSPANNRVRRFRLEFVAETAGQPVIYQMSKAFDLEFNILFASMSEIQDTVLGFMIIQLSGEAEVLRAGIAYLQHCGVRVEEVQ